MMLLGFALIGQSATLPSDTREAAMTCGAAVRAATSTVTVDDVTLATYFSLAAAADGPIETLLSRSQDDLRAMMARAPSMSDDAPALLTQCRERFPLAFAAGPVTLPTDDYTRRAVCSTSAAALSGMMKDDPEAAARLSERFRGLLTPADYSRRDITTTEKARTELGRLFKISLRFGNFQAIVRSCEVAFPA